MPGQPSQGTFLRASSLLTALHDPLQYTHVFAVPWPQEFAILTLAKPVHGKNAGRVRDAAPHAEPVREIITHVITAERQHGHRVSAHLAYFCSGGCRCL